jgi:hypothetical protein
LYCIDPICVRNPARDDQLRYADGDNAKFYEPYDVQHVQTKFASLSEQLSRRLGKSISKRRQYLKYREDHHDKLADGLDGELERESTVATSLRTLEVTSVTLGAANTESDYTATSYAPTEGGHSLLRPPRLPAAAGDNTPFEFVLCYHIITANDERA